MDDAHRHHCGSNDVETTNNPNNNSSSSSALVLLLCGLPGSGKSTLAKQIVASSLSNRKTWNNKNGNLHKVDSNSNDTETFSLPSLKFFNRIVHIEYDKVAQDILDETPMENTPHTAIHHDGLFFTEQSLEAWRKSRLAALEQLKEELQTVSTTTTINNINNANDNDTSNSSMSLIIMDDNFHLRSMRRDVYRACQEYCSSSRIYFSIIWVNTPLHICQERNLQRKTSDVIPNHVIQNLWNKMEPPNPTKATWEQSNLRLYQSPNSKNGNDNGNDNDNYNYNDIDSTSTSTIMEQINTFLSSVVMSSGPASTAATDGSNRSSATIVAHQVLPPPPPIDPELLQQEQKRTLESRMHYFDRILRTWVGQVAKLHRTQVRHANLARKEILSQLKHSCNNTTPQQTEDDDPLLTPTTSIEECLERVMELFIAILIRESSSSEWEHKEDDIMAKLQTAFQESSAKIPYSTKM